jgi:hypothetical protein
MKIVLAAELCFARSTGKLRTVRKCTASSSIPKNVQEMHAEECWDFLQKLNIRMNEHLHEAICHTDRSLVIVSFSPSEYDHLIQQIAIISSVAEWSDRCPSY